MEKIKASEGMYLTQKNLENESGRTFALTLYLADNDSADNWREATQEEYYKWQRAMDEQAEEALEKGHERAAQKEE